MIVVLHETDIFGLTRQPYLSISFLDGDGNTYHRRRPLFANEKIDRSKDPFLRVSGGTMEEDEQGIRLNIQVDDCSFSGTIRRLTPPCVIADGVLFRSPDSDQENHWVAQIPYGQFEATLNQRGMNQRLRGFAYQDHNWGTVPIQSCFANWVWGHFVNAEEAVTFYQLRTHLQQTVSRAIVSSRSHTLSSTLIDDTGTAGLNGEDISDLFASVRLPELKRFLSFRLIRSNLIRERVGESYFGFAATYRRWSACGGILNEEISHPAQGVVEHLEIRRNKR